MSTSDSHDVSFYRTKSHEFIELHDQVETSLNLLNNLESFLSTFQNDLSAVAGQISELQRRSQDIDERLKGRRKIERPLASLILDLTISPQMATVILDTPVGEPWIDAISELEVKIDAIQARGRVKASKDLGDVAQALGIVAATKLRAFFLALLQPIRTNMTSNMQILQTSVLLKYRSLFGYIQRHHSTVAVELQRAYMGVARTYYETGFRRYIRSLSTIKSRSGEPFELIGSTSERVEATLNYNNLSYGRLDGPAVTMAFLADDKNYKEPVEGLFRALVIVVMDNATAEYSFIRQFFNRSENSLSKVASATQLTRIGEESDVPDSASVDHDRQSVSILTIQKEAAKRKKEEDAIYDEIWKQVMDPVLQYTDTFVKSILNPSILDPKPSVLPILTMTRLNEAAYVEVGRRGCGPMESFFVGIRMTLWPLFQTEMGAHVESLKKLADSAAGTLLSRGNVRDPVVRAAAQRYAIMFSSILALIEDDEEPMLFINLGRLRQELTRLITSQASKVRDPAQNAIYLATIYEAILQTLSSGPRPNIHPKAQMETAFWREREEEARRRIASSQS